MHYEIKAIQTPRNKWHWAIIGMESENYKGEKESDTPLWLVGMHHSCDTGADIADAVYSAMYDELQCNEVIKDGDTFSSVECQVAQYHSHDNRVMLTVPAMKFRVHSFHLVKE